MISVLLAAAPTGEAAKSGPWGLTIILLLVVACFFLFRSMSRHLRKVREQFPADPAPRRQMPPRPSQPSAQAPGAAPDPPQDDADGGGEPRGPGSA